MVNQIVAGIVVILSVSMLAEGNMDFKGLLSNQDIFSNAPKAWHEYVKKLLSVSTKRNSLNEYNQWRIQDFPNGGALFCHKWGGAHPVFR